MKLSIPAGTTSKRIAIFIQDSSSTTGAGLTGLVFNTSSLVCYSWIDTDGNAGGTSQALQTATLGTWTTRGFKEKDATNMPGMYEFGVPDALLAAGVKWATVMFKGATNMAPCVLEIEVTAVSNQDAVRGGMTALPNANAEAAGGLYTRGTGAGQIKQTNNGEIDSNVTHINNVATTSVTTINANQGTTGVVTFTVAAQVDVNVKDWAGTAVTAPNTAGTPVVDVTRWLGTTVSTPTTGGVPNVNAKTWNDLATVALPLVPTTAGRTLDVSAGGEAGLDWANVGSPTTAVDLSGTTIKTTQKVDVDTIKTNPVVNAGTITFPTTATLASTTNITGGTITNVTNLTNAPTAGDFTATMKTSIGTAVAASAVASVTGNVGGNVVGSTGSVTGNVGGNVVGSVGSVTAGVTLAASQLFIKKNTQFTSFMFKMVLASDHVTAATGKTITATRAIDGGAFASCANSVTEISAGWYKITLATTDLNGANIALKFTEATCDQRDILIVTQA